MINKHKINLNFWLSYTHTRTQEQITIDRCAAILALDYSILEISNNNGDLAYNYPSRILIPEAETSVFSSPTIYEHAIDATRLHELCRQARAARCRTRFPVPVIIYRGNYICRSATLSGYSEMVGRYGLDAFSKWYSMVKNAYKYRSTDDDEDGGQNEGTILMDNNLKFAKRIIAKLSRSI